MKTHTYLIKFLLAVFLCFEVTGAYAEEVLSCEEIFTYAKFDLPREQLVAPSEIRTRWIHAQQRFAKDFFKKSRNRKALEAFYFKEFDESRSLMTYNAPQKAFNLYLMNRGLGKATELVYQKTNAAGKLETRILYSTHSEVRNGSVFSTQYSVSPNNKYVVVSEGRNGTTDLYNFRIIEIQSGLEVGAIKDLSSATPVWTGYEDFAYLKSVESGLFWKHAEIANSIEEKPLQYSNNVFHSKDKKFFFAKDGNSKKYLKTLEGNNWQEIDFEVESFIEGPIGNEIYAVAKTENGFGEIRAVTIVNGIPQMNSRLVHKSEEGKVIRGSWQQAGQLVVYENSKIAKNLKILSKDGAVVKNLGMPSCCTVYDVEMTDLSKITIAFISPIVSYRKISIDLVKNQYLDEDPNTVMMTDDSGQEYETEFVEFQSADGGNIPMRLVYKKGLKRDSSNPLVMPGYGGFRDSGHYFPSYTATSHLALKSGAIWATPALRGGGEFGDAWFKSGVLENKQNTINDYIAAAEFLVKYGYSRPEKMAAIGWSGGGFLMGSVLTQRPDLFGVVVVGNGVLDMMNKETLDFKRNKGFKQEYGDSQTPEFQKVIAAYAPLNNVKPAIYPTVVIANGISDTRVNGAHSYQFTQALQSAQLGPKPIVQIALKNAGHFLTDARYQKLISWRANVMIWSTIFDTIGVEVLPKVP